MGRGGGGGGGPLVIVGKARSFGGDPLEDVVDERVHDRHGLAADSGVRMDLLQHLVDVDKVALLSPLLVLLIAGPGGFGLADGLFGSLTGWLWRHDDDDNENATNLSYTKFSARSNFNLYEKKVIIWSRDCQIEPMAFSNASTNGKAYVSRRREHVTKRRTINNYIGVGRVRKGKSRCSIFR